MFPHAHTKMRRPTHNARSNGTSNMKWPNCWGHSLHVSALPLCRTHRPSIPWWERSFIPTVQLLQKVRLMRRWRTENYFLWNLTRRYGVHGDKTVTIKCGTSVLSKSGVHRSALWPVVLQLPWTAMTAWQRPTYAAEEKHRSTNQESTIHTKIITTTREHATIWK